MEEFEQERLPRRIDRAVREREWRPQGDEERAALMAALERGSTLLPSFGLRPALFVPLFDDDDPWGPSRYRLREAAMPACSVTAAEPHWQRVGTRAIYQSHLYEYANDV